MAYPKFIKVVGAEANYTTAKTNYPDSLIFYQNGDTKIIWAKNYEYKITDASVFESLKARVDALDSSMGEFGYADVSTFVHAVIKEAIEGVDVAVAAGDGKVLTGFEIEDGKLKENSVTTLDVASSWSDASADAAKLATLGAVKGAISDLAGAMHFVGTQEDVAKAGFVPKKGDVYINTETTKEYVYDGAKWVELGDETLYETKADASLAYAALRNKDASLQAEIDELKEASAHTTVSSGDDNTLLVEAGVDASYVVTVQTSTIASNGNGLVTSKDASAVTVAISNALAAEAEARALADASLDASIQALIGAQKHTTVAGSGFAKVEAGTDASYVVSVIVDGSVAENDASLVKGGDVYAAVEAAKSEIVGDEGDTSTALTLHGLDKKIEAAIAELDESFTTIDASTFYTVSDKAAAGENDHQYELKIEAAKSGDASTGATGFNDASLATQGYVDAALSWVVIGE